MPILIHFVPFYFDRLLFWVISFDCYYLFFLRHAHYQAGITPLALVWKDENCSQYVMDTDSKGQVPDQQQVVSLASFSFYYCFVFSCRSIIVCVFQSYDFVDF